jgi:hypothetical protein
MVGDYGFDILSLGACPFPENFSLAALLSRQLLRAMRPAAADTRCLGAAPPRSAGPALHRTASPLSRPEASAFRSPVALLAPAERY